MSIENLYSRYYNFVSEIVNKNDLSSFKSNDDYCGMLEHVTYELGVEYLNIIRKNTHLSDKIITNYCKKNDLIGGGKKYDYGFIVTSPTNFRYILHSHLILSHMSKLDMEDTNIIEIGGGYGGLCLAIDMLSRYYNVKINNYTLIDLPAVTILQKKYLDSHKMECNVKFLDAFNYGSEINESNNFLVSNYSFSEISKEHQERYIKTLFPKISHGFFAWNYIPVYNFGFNYKEEVEYPLTFTLNSFNKYVYF